jgi:methionine-rich copper-binding protein CopC
MVPMSSLGRHLPSAIGRAIGGLAVVAATIALAPAAVDAHEGIAESDPPSGSTLDDPISEVSIEFGTTIGDDTEIAVFGPDGEPLDTVTTVVSDTAAIVEFDEIDQKGTYIARYLTSSVQDGHLLAGAISFDYGSASSGPSALAWVLVLGAAVVILSIGAYFSFRKYRALSAGAEGPDGESQVDDDLSDVGV